MIVKVRLPGQDAVHEYAFARSQAVVGSSRRTDICLALPGVGLRHLRLRRIRGGVRLEPIRSGALVRLLRPDQSPQEVRGPIELAPGDVIELGAPPNVAQIELVAHTVEGERGPRCRTVCQFSSSERPEAEAPVLAVLIPFAVAAARVGTLAELARATAEMAGDLLGQSECHGGLVVFQPEAGRPPELAMAKALEGPLVSGPKALLGRPDWRSGLGRRMARGEVLAAELEGGQRLYLVPILAGGRSRGFWAVMAPAREGDDRALGQVAETAGRILAGGLDRLAQAREIVDLREENRYFRMRERRHYLYKDLVTESAAMQAVYEAVHRLAPANLPVLILGEKGSGKEMIARALHHLGPRAEALMISLDCAGLPEDELDAELFGRVPAPEDEDAGGPAGTFPRRGLLELTRSGTLFLESIDRLPVRLQTKLSRTISEREVRREGEPIGHPIQARIAVSSEQDLFHLVERGLFRKDLYLPLAQHTVVVPPLRQRTEDIVPLANVFAAQFGRRYRKSVARVDPLLRERLTAYPWPGNVRELQGVIEAAVIAVDASATALTRLPRLGVED